jgi:hypothetical protein
LQAVTDKVTTKLGLPSIHIQRNSLQSDKGGADLHGLEGFAIEVKFCENEQLNQWWAQAVRQAVNLRAVPVLFYRPSHVAWRVKLRAHILTPLNTESVGMDVLMSVDDFLGWFELALQEKLERR